jgi:hypothetical protein
MMAGHITARLAAARICEALNEVEPVPTNGTLLDSNVLAGLQPFDPLTTPTEAPSTLLRASS